MHNFKLLAIRPLDGCKTNILKVLHVGQFYFFDNSYESTIDQRWIEKRGKSFDYVSEDFFYKKENKNSTLDQINVQALVGKNGDGKSSLTELALRIFNNFFRAKKIHDVTDKLLFVDGLCAELYFLLNDEIYRIRTIDQGSDDPVAFLETIMPDNSIGEGPSLLQKLIFVMNVNYSHHALNSLDFRGETRSNKGPRNASWLDNVFHRNDGYQTPLTVHPFRTEGNIDINTERDLINQRLITLILTESSYEMINTDLKVEEIIFEKFAKEPILNDISRITQGYEEEEHRDFDDSDLSFVNLSLIIDPVSNQYFIKELINFIDSWTPPSFRQRDIRDYIRDDENFQFINGTPRERILGYLGWLSEGGQKEIMKLALMCRAMHALLPGVTFADPLEGQLFQYLCVKSKKMLRYPQYKDINTMIELRKYDEAITAYIESIKEQNSHVSLKFNQAYHLLLLSNEYPPNGLTGFYTSLLETNIEKTQVSLTIFRSYINEAIQLFGEDIPKVYLNPPGIFKNSIMLKARGREKLIDLKTISSGEYQKTSMLSSIIYHLKNIDSIKKSKYGQSNNYDNVLLILDEIELYHHPDFQRTLVNELLRKIGQIHFEKLKAINILFVTHSPFILSDIPKTNVLFVEDGLQSYPMSENTFGANIHTLFQHGFFLKGVPIGEFAKDKINELFNILNRQDTLIGKNDLEKRILMVSEPFLRSQLLKLFHERSPNAQINALQEQIDQLRKDINDRNQ